MNPEDIIGNVEDLEAILKEVEKQKKKEESARDKAGTDDGTKKKRTYYITNKGEIKERTPRNPKRQTPIEDNEEFNQTTYESEPITYYEDEEIFKDYEKMPDLPKKTYKQESPELSKVVIVHPWTEGGGSVMERLPPELDDATIDEIVEYVVNCRPRDNIDKMNRNAIINEMKRGKEYYRIIINGKDVNKEKKATRYFQRKTSEKGVNYKEVEMVVVGACIGA